MGKKAKRNMHVKGVRGEVKRYFKQGATKRKYMVDLVDGSDVVFECRQKVFVGRGSLKDGDNSYKVHSESHHKEYTISWQAHPVMLNELQISIADLKKGDTYFVVWQVLDDYLQLIPAQVVDVYDTYAWMKPDPSCHEGCLKVDGDNIYRLNRDKHELHHDVETLQVTMNHDEVNVAWLLLQASQTQLENLGTTYTSTLQQLKLKCKETDKLEEKIKELNAINKDASEAIQQFRAKLVKSESLNQAANTLYKVISEQKDKIDAQEKQLLECDIIIRELQAAYYQQTQELIAATSHVAELEKQNAELKNTINAMTSESQAEQQQKTDDAAKRVQVDELEKEIHELKEQVRDMTEEKQKLYQVNHGASNTIHVTARPAGTQKRGASFIPLPRPTNPSSSANRRTLKSRST
ncbi:uncharacterized protein [Amphiura filiformis]|uniref:uncharacterized protein n=1 Tax=Amphiura filiformis TaxID=82378 RepID=UPI003B220C06